MGTIAGVAGLLDELFRVHTPDRPLALPEESEGQKIMAVNGNVYSTEALHAAIRQSKIASAPMHLILQSDKLVTEADLDYHGGERYPALVRVEGTPAYLDDIAKPLVNTTASTATPSSN